MLLRGVAVTRRDHEVVDDDYLAGLVGLAVGVGVVDRGQVLLVVEAIDVSLNLLRQRSEVSKRIRCPADDVGIVAGSTPTIIHHAFALSLRSQTLVAAIEAKGIDRDHLTFLQCGGGNNFQLQIVIALPSTHHLCNHLFVILQSLLALHYFILSMLLRRYQLRFRDACAAS